VENILVRTNALTKKTEYGVAEEFKRTLLHILIGKTKVDLCG